MTPWEVYISSWYSYKQQIFLIAQQTVQTPTATIYEWIDSTKRIYVELSSRSRKSVKRTETVLPGRAKCFFFLNSLY